MQDLPVNSYDENNRMLTTPGQQMERMYPKIYYTVNPAVIRQCDILDETKGPLYIPTKEELERMTDNIQSNVESLVMSEMSEGSENHSIPVQNLYGNPRGNPYLRGLIGTLLIGELLGRRGYRPYRRYPGYYPGYYPGFYPSYYPGFYPGFIPGFY